MHKYYHNVGIGNNQFFPVSYENLKDIMKKQPYNFNYIPPKVD
jgi:hypothetical protein